MSQHHFELTHDGRELHVLMGWDRPLQGFFLVVEDKNEVDDKKAYIYSNLNDRALGHIPVHRELEYFLGQLKNLNIEIPQGMIAAVREDGVANVGNKDVWY